MEHSLLDQISKKESELKQECDLACKEAEDLIHDARVKARGQLEEAEKKGAEEALVFMQKGMAELSFQVEEIRKAGEREAADVLSRGEKNVDNAIIRIAEKAR